jgi:hypothetical protein
LRGWTEKYFSELKLEARPAERRPEAATPAAPARSLGRLLALNLALAAVYYLGGSLGLRLASPHQTVTLVWPPSGWWVTRRCWSRW